MAVFCLPGVTLAFAARTEPMYCPLGFGVSAAYMQRLPIHVLSWQAALQTISPAIHFDCSPICHTNLCTQGICFLLISCLGTEGLMLTLCLSKQWVFHPVHGSAGWCLKMWDLMSVILCLHWRPCCGNADLPCWEHCFYACCHFNTRVLTCLCFRSLFILQKGRILKPWWAL